MGLAKNFKSFCVCLFLFLFLVLINASCTSTSSSHEIQPQAAADVPPVHYHVFYIKNTKPFVLNKQDHDLGKKRRSKKKMRRKKIKNINSRPFSVMLPKGFVPPSGSSPCHNEYPNSVTFFCEFSTAKP
ncbi:hypothetical protein CJ030_MR2G005425 [Morella rubra]|uniref:Transmembrane protein n=1 Tax=Morella rubra TaxID=262757 RepID=A0A6A1WCC0_9ROSI|nr:hypothetical protein CJ030_MR2G005627 [Morella rubra]KAB1221334.1 hypothetical protein CJ030_MR2G005425 [Morella rubra]